MNKEANNTNNDISPKPSSIEKASETYDKSLKEQENNKGFLGIIFEVIKTVFIVLLFVLGFKLIFVQPFYVIGSSMVPTFHNGEYIFIDEISYRVGEPVRGDVIVFRHPDETCSPYVENHVLLKGIFEGPCMTYIKRIVGLPGDTVEIKDGNVTIFNNENPSGILLNEQYIENNIKTLGNIKTTLTDGEYFVLGDNRNPNASSDSREWGILKEEFIVGRAWIRLLPIDSAKIFKKINY